MAVTDDMVAAMRAYLTRDYEQFQRRNEALSASPAGRRQFLAMLTASFVEAVEQRFSPDATPEEIIDFVANLRARDDKLAELDPDATERMITWVRDETVETGDIDPDTSVGIRMMVLAQIAYDADLDAPELEAFLDRARVLANEILG